MVHIYSVDNTDNTYKNGQITAYKIYRKSVKKEGIRKPVSLPKMETFKILSMEVFGNRFRSFATE